MNFHSVGNGKSSQHIPTDFHSIIFQRGRYSNHQPVSIMIPKEILNGHQLCVFSGTSVPSAQYSLSPYQHFIEIRTQNHGLTTWIYSLWAHPYEGISSWGDVIGNGLRKEVTVDVFPELRVFCGVVAPLPVAQKELG